MTDTLETPTLTLATERFIPALKAVTGIAKRADKARGVLRTVRFEPHAEGVLLIATDSYKLVAILVEGDATEFEAFSLSVEDAQMVLKMAGGVMAWGVSDAGVLFRSGVEFTAKPYDGSYPNWRNLVPRDDQLKQANGPATFDPEHLGDVMTALKALGRDAYPTHLGHVEGIPNKVAVYVAKGHGWQMRALVVPRSREAPTLSTF